MSVEEQYTTIEEMLHGLRMHICQLQEEQVSTTQALMQLIAMQAEQKKPYGMGPNKPLTNEQLQGLEGVFPGFTERYRAREQDDIRE